MHLGGLDSKYKEVYKKTCSQRVRRMPSGVVKVNKLTYKQRQVLEVDIVSAQKSKAKSERIRLALIYIFKGKQSVVIKHIFDDWEFE